MGGDEEDDHGVAPGGRTAKGRARQTIISDKGKRPKKSTMNVRTAVLYKKTLAVLIEDSVRACMPSAPPDPSDALLLCARRACLPCYVTPGHRASAAGRAHVPEGCGPAAPRAAADVVFRLRLLGEIQMQALCDAVLRPQLRRRAQRDPM